MPNTFDHFVITRFNVRLPWLSRFQAESRFCNPEWLRGRIELFDKYCFPSVANQTSTNFRWLVYFDIESPDFLRDAIREWQKYPPFEPHFVDGLTSDDARAAIRGMVNPKHSHVLTTRLDSDDMLANTFVQSVQPAAQSLDHAFVNLLHGYQIHDGHVYTVSLERNPFISLMEPVEKLSTVLCTAHGDAHVHAPVVDNTEGRLWAQIIHGGNVANELDAGRERFPIWLAAKSFSPLRVMSANMSLGQRASELAASSAWALKKVRNRLGLGR